MTVFKTLLIGTDGACGIQDAASYSVGGSRPPSRRGRTDRASPVLSSVSTIAAQSVPSPSAGDRRSPGIFLRKRWTAIVLLHADHRIVVAAHADIGLVGRAAGQHPGVGGRNMAVGAQHRRHAAVAVMAHRLLLAGRLAVHIDQDEMRRAAERILGELRIDGAERIVERIHEQPAHDIDDDDLLAARRLKQVGAPARRAGWEIDSAAAAACPARCRE